MHHIRSCYEQDNAKNTKWCRKKAMPSVSYQFLICLTRVVDQLLKLFFTTLLLPSFSAIYSEARKSELSTMIGRKSTIVWNSVAAGGGRNQPS